MFNKLSIKNFRSIENLEIDDINRINIFVGENNSGKTSILEALFLLIGISNPRLNVTINNFRDLILTENNDLCFNFRNLSMDNHIELIAYENRSTFRKLIITPKISRKTTSTSNDQNISSLIDIEKEIININAETKSKEDIQGLNLDYSISPGSKKYHAELNIDEAKVNSTIDNNYRESLLGHFYNNKTIYGSLPDKISELLQKKKKDKLINLLKIVDNKVEDIALSRSGMIFIDIGLNEMIPINIMGDGFKKVCAVIANLLVLDKGIFLIDEIENGLHSITQELIWKSILEISEKLKQQLFIATHSYETIKILLGVIQNNDLNENNIRVYAIHKNKEGKHSSYKYKYDNLKASIRANIDIRKEQ